MTDWNQDLNPIPAEGKLYLSKFSDKASSDGNPVEDLTDIMLNCYEMLSTISKNYTPTGDSRQDNSVNRLKALLDHWPASEVNTLREGAALDHAKPTHAPPPPPTPEVLAEKEVTPPHNQGSALSNKNDDNQKSIPKSNSNSSLSSNSKDNTKNNDYFLRLKEDEAAAKKKQEAEEAKMKPEALKKLQEERRLAEEHDSSKTAHLSKLGSKFMPAKKKNSGGDVILERGGGGRGRGRGRGH